MFMDVNESINFTCINETYKQKFHAGVYKIECWGASGGDSDEYKGGRGAYVSGVIYFQSNLFLYISPGGQGRLNNLAAFNGGGRGVTHYGVLQPSGGGGTDIRTKANDLYSRIIVAGGGGAAIFYNNTYEADGGDAGGLVGYQGIPTGSNKSNSRPPFAGSQVGSGDGGSFGIGGSGKSCGGGGGYYGGGHSYDVRNSLSSASGGSSFISGHEGCLWVNRMTSFADSGFYFTNTTMYDGRDSFLSPTGENETGHTGDGYVRITLLELRTSISVSICHQQTLHYRCISLLTAIFIK